MTDDHKGPRFYAADGNWYDTAHEAAEVTRLERARESLRVQARAILWPEEVAAELQVAEFERVFSLLRTMEDLVFLHPEYSLEDDIRGAIAFIRGLRDGVCKELMSHPGWHPTIYGILARRGDRDD